METSNTPAGVEALSDEQMEALIESAEGAWHEDVFHIEASALCALIREAGRTALESLAGGAQPVAPTINYGVLYEFAIKQNVAYNPLCTAVRQSLAASGEAVAQPVGAVKIERGFDYLGNNVNTPFVKVFFGHDDWDSRDRLAASLGFVVKWPGADSLPAPLPASPQAPVGDNKE